MNKVISYLKRWQEFVGWLPLLVILAVVGWIVIGALDPLAVVDAMAQMVDLPIRTAQALAALGLAYLAWRRWSIRLSDPQLEDYWRRLMDGERGAIVVFIVNAGFYLCVSLSLLLFFS